jgi:hypothetical protein
MSQQFAYGVYRSSVLDKARRERAHQQMERPVFDRRQPKVFFLLFCGQTNMSAGGTPSLKANAVLKTDLIILISKLIVNNDVEN